MKSAIALSQHNAVESTTPQMEEDLADLLMGVNTPRESALEDAVVCDASESSASTKASQHDITLDVSPDVPSLQSALQEIDRLQLDVAGMEAIVSAVKGVQYLALRLVRDI